MDQASPSPSPPPSAASPSSSSPGRPYPPPAAAEPFWPAQATILAAIALQLLLPSRLTVGPHWLIPSLEGALLLGMFMATPRQLEHEHPRRRRVALGLTAFVSAANIYSLGALTHFLLHHDVQNGRQLITSGVLIWLTNFLIFALWYWEADRGGPGRRAAGHDGPPDFLFPQMSDDRIEPLDVAAEIHRLPVRLAHQRYGLLPHRHDAAVAHRQEHHGHSVDRLAGHDRPDRLARGQHLGLIGVRERVDVILFAPHPLYKMKGKEPKRCIQTRACHFRK